MYVCEDSNFGCFRLPCVYVHTHKWLKNQILGKHRPLQTFAVLGCNCSVIDLFNSSSKCNLHNVVSIKAEESRFYLQYQGKMVYIF